MPFKITISLAFSLFLHCSFLLAQERPINCSMSSEILVMPDGRMSFRRTLEFFHDGDETYFNFSENEIKEFVPDSIVDKQTLTDRKGIIKSLPPSVTKEKGITRYEFLVYCRDINKFSHDGNTYELVPSDRDLKLTMRTSFFESSGLYCKNCREIVTMPGKVLSSVGCHRIDGRSATTELFDKEMTPAGQNKKFFIANESPRNIVCASSEVSVAEIESFNKRFEAAMNSK